MPANGPAGRSRNARGGIASRAVYSLFGSKQGLLTALAEQAYEQLHATVAALPETDDPVADLLAAGVHGFRPLVRAHPSLFRIAFQRVVPGLRQDAELTAARERALAPLITRIQRVHEAGLLGSTPIREAAIQFQTMCEGLANAELRGAILRILPEGDEETAWRHSLATVVRGFRADDSRRDGDAGRGVTRKVPRSARIDPGGETWERSTRTTS